jgi:hypothetical protein
MDARCGARKSACLALPPQASRRQPRLPRVMTRIGVNQDVSILKFIHHAAYASKRIEALKLLLTNK